MTHDRLELASRAGEELERLLHQSLVTEKVSEVELEGDGGNEAKRAEGLRPGDESDGVDVSEDEPVDEEAGGEGGGWDGGGLAENEGEQEEEGLVLRTIPAQLAEELDRVSIQSPLNLRRLKAYE